MRRLALAVLLLLALPAAASAHSTITIQRADITYASEDAVSDNKLTVDENATEIHFYDPEADNGIAAPASCRTGRTDANGYPVEVWCPKAGLQRLTIDLGPNEDTATVTLAAITTGASGGNAADSLKTPGTADLLSGDQGNDILDAGDGNDDVRGLDGNDTLTGGGGNDSMQAGPGADTVDAGEGDDTIATPDGVKDTVTCGGGTDTVRADTADEVAADCENVERQAVAPPTDQPTGEDNTKPTVKVGGYTLQRVTRRRRSVRIAVTLSEAGVVSGSGFLDAGGLNTPIRTRDYPITVAGGGVTVKCRLTRRQVRLVKRTARRGRRASLRISIVGTDRAGNASVARTFKIRLR